MTDHNEETEEFDPVQLKLDIKAMGTYVRTELFQWVKLAKIWSMGVGISVTSTRPVLLIEQAARGVSTVDRTRYIACLWQHALKERVYGYQLSTRRSGVCTVMYHHFRGEW